MRLFGKIAISAILIWLLFYKYSFDMFMGYIGDYSPQVLLLALCVHIVTNFIGVWRWSLLLPEVPYYILLRMTIVAQFYSFVLPGQVTGDIVKTYRLSTLYKGSFGKIGVSVFIDKVIGMLGLLVVTLAGMLVTTSVNIPLSTVVPVLLTFLIFAVSLIPWVQDRFILLLNVLIPQRWLSKSLIAQAQGVFAHYRQVFKDYMLISSSLLLAVVYQLSAVLITFLLGRAIGIDVLFVDWLWVFGIVSFALFLPVTVAGLGLREGLFVFFLTDLGVDASGALAVSLGVLMLQFFTAIAGGVLELLTPVVQKSATLP